MNVIFQWETGIISECNIPVGNSFSPLVDEGDKKNEEDSST